MLTGLFACSGYFLRAPSKFFLAPRIYFLPVSVSAVYFAWSQIQERDVQIASLNRRIETATRYHSPEMRHFDALEAKIEDLQARLTKRNMEFQKAVDSNKVFVIQGGYVMRYCCLCKAARAGTNLIVLFHPHHSGRCSKKSPKKKTNGSKRWAW